jgi:hypothetical protein
MDKLGIWLTIMFMSLLIGAAAGILVNLIPAAAVP